MYKDLEKIEMFGTVLKDILYLYPTIKIENTKNGALKINRQ